MSEFIRELASKCYYGSDAHHNVLTFTPSDNITPQPGIMTSPHHQRILRRDRSNPSVMSNSGFVSGLFSDNEEFDDKLQRFKESIHEFDEDSDSHTGINYDELVNENHFR